MTTTTRTATASLYLRLSAASDEDSTGLGSQEADLRRLAEERGLQVVAVHTDDGLSGALRNRPGFLAWLEDGRSGRADNLLAWKLDRVSRGGSAGLARFLDVLEGVDDEGRSTGRGARFLSWADRLDSSAPGWDVQAAVLGAIAKGERDAIRARMLRHRESNRASGRVVGGRRAWLFETAPRPGGGLRLVPVPAHADAVRSALEILRAGGSLGEVVRDWTARGVEPKDGGSWHVSPLRRILANPNLYGATTHRGALVREEDGTVRTDEEQAVLSLGEWQDLQALLANRSTSRAARSEDPALLAGLLSCGSCSRVLYPHRPGGGRTHTYRCRGGSGCERPTSVVMTDAEEFLVEAFRATIGDRPVPATTVRAPRVDADEVARLEEALGEVEERLSRDLPDEEGLQALRSRRDLRERLAALQDAEVEVSREASGLTYGETYDAAETVEERTRLLGLTFERVEVEPASRGGARGDVADRFRLLADVDAG
jgi:DNA invertase Pin-like site-specific DNA recombinase